MQIDLLNTEYSYSKSEDFKETFHSLSAKQKKEMIKALVLKSLPESSKEYREAGFSPEQAKENSLRTLGIHWAITLGCEREYHREYRAYILNGSNN